MLCYVGGTTRKYFKWEDNQWSEFSSGNGGGNSLIFRVDTIEDRDSINTVTLEYGSLCHVLNDVNFRYMYYYGKNGWTSISHEYKVWIGKEPPQDKKSLWVDTRIIEADPNKQNTYPPIIKYLVDLVNRQNNTIINLSSQISILENEIDLIKQAIENGGGGIVDNNIYLTTEDDKIFITEDGIPIITEEGNTEPPTKPPTETIDRILLTEDGNYFITEDGKYFELETKTPTSDSSGDEGDTTHTITNNLTNCTTNNNNESVSSNSSYSAIITANNGYTNLSITVTMGEIDITSNVVRGNIINIPNVTGNISITARATQSSTEVVVDESLEILTSFNYINMTEGGYKVLYVKLSKQPTSNVVVNISSSSSNLSLSKSSLTFTNTNWYTSQSINIISSSDTNTIDETYQLTLLSSGLVNKVVTIDVVDESNSGFEVLYNNGELISGASLSLNNATNNGTYITTNMNADESIIISGYKLNLNKNDKVHLLVGLATTDPASIYSIRSMQLGDNSANDISGSNMISEEAISKNLVNGKVDTYWTIAGSLSNIELTFTGYFARVNIYKIYIERGN